MNGPQWMPRRKALTAAAAGLLGIGAARASPAAAREAVGSTRTRTIEAKGVRFAYRELGPIDSIDPTPILLLNRFRGTLDDWDPAFLDELARTRRVLVFSNSGIGSSSGEVARSIEKMASNAADFAAAIGVSRVDVLGWSMGGFVAQVMALEEPALVRRLVLVGSGPGGSPENAPPDEKVFSVATRPTYGPEEVSYLFFAKGRETQARASSDRIAARAGSKEPQLAQAGIETQAASIQAFMGGSTGHFARLRQLRQATLIVSGDRDPFFPLKNVWLLHREIPDSQLLVLPGAGHAPHHQHPSEVAQTIASFLASKT